MDLSRMASEMNVLASSLEEAGMPELLLVARDVRRVATLFHVGGKHPTIELADASMTESGVEQSWIVRFQDKEKEVRTLTSGAGDISLLNGGSNDMGIWKKGEEDEWSPLTTASEAVMFIMRKAHPKYYPAIGEHVSVDPTFISDLEQARPID